MKTPGGQNDDSFNLSRSSEYVILNDAITRPGLVLSKFSTSKRRPKVLEAMSHILEMCSVSELSPNPDWDSGWRTL